MSAYVLEFLCFSALLVVPLGLYLGIASGNKARRRATIESRCVVTGSLVGYLGVGLLALSVLGRWIGTPIPLILGAVASILGGLVGLGCVRSIRMIERDYSDLNGDFADDEAGNPVRQERPD